MPRLNFKVSADCFGAGNEALLKEFKRHLHVYGVKSLKTADQRLIDCAYDLFHIVQTQRSSIYELETKLNIRPENNTNRLNNARLKTEFDGRIKKWIM